MCVSVSGDVAVGNPCLMSQPSFPALFTDVRLIFPPVLLSDSVCVTDVPASVRPAYITGGNNKTEIMFEYQKRILYFCSGTKIKEKMSLFCVITDALLSFVCLRETGVSSLVTKQLKFQKLLKKTQ